MIRRLAGVVVLSTLLVVGLALLGIAIGPEPSLPGPRSTPTTYGYPPR